MPLYMAEASEKARALAEQPSALSHLISKCCEELVLSQVLKTKFTCGLDNPQAAKSIIIQLHTGIAPCACVQILTLAIFSQYLKKKSNVQWSRSMRIIKTYRVQLFDVQSI